MEGSESADCAARRIAWVGRRVGFGQPRRRLMGLLVVILCRLRIERGKERFLGKLSFKREKLVAFNKVIEVNENTRWDEMVQEWATSSNENAGRDIRHFELAHICQFNRT